MASAVWHAFVPLPQAVTTVGVWSDGRAATAPRSVKRRRSSVGGRKRPSRPRLPAIGAEMAVGMWPAAGSIGSTSPR